MTPLAFVACNDTACPLNEGKQCRAPFIAVNEHGICIIRDSGPHHNKSETERYVEIMECQCQKCNHWEVDEAKNVGSCGFRDKLFFNQFKLADGTYGPPTCNEIAKQISQPGFPKNS